MIGEVAVFEEMEGIISSQKQQKGRSLKMVWL